MKKTILALMLMFGSATLINATTQNPESEKVNKCQTECQKAEKCGTKCDTPAQCENECKKDNCKHDNKCKKQCDKKVQCTKENAKDCNKEKCDHKKKCGKKHRPHAKAECPHNKGMHKHHKHNECKTFNHPSRVNPHSMALEGIQLDDKQKEKIDELNNERNSIIGRIQVDSRKEMRKVAEDYDKKMKKILTTEQYQQYQNNKEQFKDKRNCPNNKKQCDK